MSCEIEVRFEDVLLGDACLLRLNCSRNSRLFPFYLRKALYERKFILPYEQTWTPINNNTFSFKIRQRNPKELVSLQVCGHSYANEYTVLVHPTDTILDLKFIMSPIVNIGWNAENLQFNYNTQRRLGDDEVLSKINLLNTNMKIMYWFEFENNNKGESSIIQTVSKIIDYNYLYPNLGIAIRKTCQNNIDSTVQTFGYRTYLDKNDFTKRGPFGDYLTYKIINNRVDYISCAFKYILGLKGGDGGDVVGLCSRNRREWLLCDYACSVSSIITVPLYPTLAHDALEYITNNASISTIVCDTANLNEIIKLFKICKSLKRVIIMDDELIDQVYLQSDAFKKLSQEYGNRLYILSLLESQSKEDLSNKKYAVKDNLPGLDDVYTIMYTSGTTGPPKGVMLTHKNIMSVLNSWININLEERQPLPNPDSEFVHLSYLPLSHVMERAINLANLMKGYKCVFWRNDPTTLIEDMNLIKPPGFFGVPRIFQRIQDAVTNKIENSSFIIKKLFNYAYQRKLNNIMNRNDPSFIDKILNKVLFQKINDQFGGNVVMVGSGSAPLSKELALFLKITLANIVGEGYGLTETTAGGTGTHEFDLTYGHVGLPRINMQLKLVDVPEMGYLTRDKPNPRGEIWFKGPSIFKGYYKMPEKTAEVITKDGWFKTGDIGVFRSEGRLQIIDRKKNIFKLSQGEYIRPEFIQNIYKQSRYINNIFIYGDSLQNYLVAVIVPDFEVYGSLGYKVETENDKKALIKDEKVKKEIFSDMKLLEEKYKLNGFERAKKMVLDWEEFTTDNGLLTISMKMKRKACREKYQNVINQMYSKKNSKL